MAIGSGGALRAGMVVRGDGIHGKQEGETKETCRLKAEKSTKVASGVYVEAIYVKTLPSVMLSNR